MSRFLSTLAVMTLIAGLVAGCGGKIEETYVMVSLREAGHGQVKSPGFMYGFDTPNFIAARGDLALVREGNLIEFFTGMDIENKIKRVEGRKFTVCARKIYSPVVHFSVDFMVAGADTVWVGEPYGVKFPAMIRGFDEGQFDDIDLSRLGPDTRRLGDIFNTKFKIEKAKVSYEEVAWLGEPRMAWLLNLDNIRFFIQDPAPEMELLLAAFMNERLYFDGGVAYGSRPPDGTRDYRNRTRIAGPVTLEYVRYGGSVLPVVRQ